MLTSEYIRGIRFWNAHTLIPLGEYAKEFLFAILEGGELVLMKN